MATPSFGSVCAVVITYNIGNGFDVCFKSLKSQVDHVMIVNTSTDGNATGQVLEKCRGETTTIIESPENNLGMAQNIGIEAALAAGFDWVLLLDHDSRLGAGMVAAMERAYLAQPDREKIGLIAPCLQDPDVASQPRYLVEKGKSFAQAEITDSVLKGVICVSASGSLIPARVFRDLGLRMDERLVIDFIDTEFCLRLRSRGQRILAVRDAKLIHRIGERREHRFLGMRATTTNHSALRRYYQYRNRLLVWKRYMFYETGFFLFDVARVGYELWRIALFEDDKLLKMRFILRGIVDAILGRDGAKAGISLRRS